MKTSESTAPAVLGQVEEAVSRPRMVGASVLQCLVVSASQTRRNMLSDAAATAGWDAIVCADPQNALAEFRKTAFQFAVVDLDLRGKTPQGFRECVRTLAEDSSRILICICGHEQDPAEEVWVRQLGAWVYLPGATNSSELSSHCERAMLVVKKQQSDQEAPMK